MGQPHRFFTVYFYRLAAFALYTFIDNNLSCPAYYSPGPKTTQSKNQTATIYVKNQAHRFSPCGPVYKSNQSTFAAVNPIV